jgi:glycine/D-amino acid oxidase-like deaminating enzyme
VSDPAPDYLVAGQGLAGTVFALSAIQRGLRVRVIDPEEPTSCSRVAAGLMNPLSGPRLNLGPLEEAYWEHARSFYRHWEPILGVRCLEERPILRLLTHEDDARQWSKRASDPRYAPWHAPLPADWDASRYHNSLGGFTTLRCGRLDTVRFLDAARDWLRQHGSYERKQPIGGRLGEGAGADFIPAVLQSSSNAEFPLERVQENSSRAREGVGGSPPDCRGHRLTTAAPTLFRLL